MRKHTQPRYTPVMYTTPIPIVGYDEAADRAYHERLWQDSKVKASAESASLRLLNQEAAIRFNIMFGEKK